MKKTNELTYTVSLHNGILDIRLVRETFWDRKIHLFEAYEENYIHYKIFANHYYHIFVKKKKKKNHTVFDYHSQNC